MHHPLSYEHVGSITWQTRGKTIQFNWILFYWNFCTKQPFFTSTDATYTKCIFVCGSVEMPVYINFSCSFQTLLSCSNTGSLSGKKRTATFFQIQCGDNNTNFPLQYSNLYPNLFYSHRCSARNCNNVTTNSPKHEFHSLLAVYSSDLVLNQIIGNKILICRTTFTFATHKIC